jgi:PHD/YefM family antitoxin component YafN of YafNO toxin-antitoxin module
MKTPQIESVTDFRTNYKATFDKLANGPVFLLQRSDIAAVLLSRVEYDALIERIEELEDIVAVQEYERRKAAGDVTYRELSPAEIAAWAGDAIPA